MSTNGGAPVLRTIKTSLRGVRARLSRSVASLVERNHRFSAVSSKLYSLVDRHAPRYMPLLSSNDLTLHTQVVFPATRATLTAPRSLGEQSKQFEVCVPSVRWSLLQDCACNAFSSVLVDHRLGCARTQIVPSSTLWGDASLTQSWVHTHGHRAALVRAMPSRRVQSAIFCGHAYANNWYHWLVEACSRLRVLEEIGGEFRSWPLIVPDFVADDSSLSRLFRLLCGDRAIIPLAFDESCRADRLLWIDLTSVAPPLHFPNGNISIADHLVHPTGFTNYVSWLRDRLHVPHPSSKTRRLFLMRAQSQSGAKRGSPARRNIRSYNQAECFSVASRYGFEPIWLDELSLEEQVKSLASADAIIGPTGAAWANLAFATGPTKALMWAPLASSQLAHYSVLAQYSKTDLAYLFFDLDLEDVYSFVSYADQYKLPPDLLDASLSQLLQR